MSFYSTLSTIAAPFPLFGSSAMLYVISRSKAKLSTTLNCLLVGLCVDEIIFSFTMLFSKAIITYEDRARIDPADGSDFSYTVPITQLFQILSLQPMIREHNDDSFSTIHALNSKHKDSISPELLSQHITGSFNWRY